MALASLLGRDLPKAAASGGSLSPTDPLLPKLPHFAPKAKRVIYLHLTGSPPHLDIFDYKPEAGEALWRAGAQTQFLEGKRFAFTKGVPKLMGTPRTFKQYGENGMWLSDAVPQLPWHRRRRCA